MDADLDAIRAYIGLDGGTVEERTLLAEVDRLTEDMQGIADSIPIACRAAVKNERARIRAAVEALRFMEFIAATEDESRFVNRAAVLAAIGAEHD